MGALSPPRIGHAPIAAAAKISRAWNLEERKPDEKTISEIFKDHSTRNATDVFTVRVDETEETLDAP
jgi:hypothetical protein